MGWILAWRWPAGFYILPPQMTGPRTNEGRQDWVDRVRGLALLLVVLQHAGAYNVDLWSVPEWFQGLRNMLAPFRMPLLMMLAGLFLERSLRKGAAPFLKVKLRQVVWPFLVWTVISLVLTGEAEQLLEVKVWRGGTYLWFPPFLFAYFLVALLVRRVPYLLAAMVALVISILARDGSRHGEQLFVLMAYFFIGAWLGRDLPRLSAWLTWRNMLLLAPFALLAAVASMQSGRVKFNPLWLPVVVPAVLFLFALVHQLKAGAATRVLEFVGRQSVVFYVVNSPVYMILVPWLAARDMPPHAILGISLLVALVATTVLALAKARTAAVAALFEFPRSGRAAVPGIARADA
jgi:surface polysaccharide O-acyltransferase-like enzyme